MAVEKSYTGMAGKPVSDDYIPIEGIGVQVCGTEIGKPPQAIALTLRVFGGGTIKVKAPIQILNDFRDIRDDIAAKWPGIFK